MAYTYQIIRTTDEFADLRSDWSRLLAQTAEPSPFLTWEWLHTWWRHYAEGKPDRILTLAIERRDGQLTGVLPGYVRAGGPLTPWTYALLGTQFESSDYLRAIVEPDRETEAVSALLSHVLRELPRIDLLNCSHVLSDASFLGALEAFASRIGASYESRHHRVCPYIDLSTSTDWEAFLAARSSNHRAKVRRFLRRVAEAGAVFGRVDQRSDVRTAVAELFSLHERRFEAKNADSIFKADVRLPFHSDVSELFFDKDILRLFQLRAGGKTIAALYCFEFGGGLYYFQAGIDPEWEEQNVGLVIMAHAIKYAFERDLRLFDFMRGGEPYKYRWTDTVRDLVVARAGVSAKGRAALSLERQWSAAKGVVKKFVRPTPPVTAPS